MNVHVEIFVEVHVESSCESVDIYIQSSCVYMYT